MSNQSDIINLIANGDKGAFHNFYKQFSEQVHNTALSYIQDKQIAEEITQDVFIKVFKNAHKFEGKSSISTWIYRITVNTSLNYLNRKNRMVLFKLGFKEKNRADFEHPGILLQNKENGRLLFKAIDSLPDSQKTAFILSYIEALPRQEVADIMESSLKAVESLLQRGKKNLRNKLEKMFPDRRKHK